ncbi:MAG: PaaI family thioesterase [Deltaproteobacteria bacterium]|nr:MAG: PaaI family thioesterase [Deltaproteobacteria bacterium]
MPKKPGKNKYSPHFLKRDAVQGFTEYCGLTSVSMEPGRFVTRIKIEKHHLQQDGFVHAGVIATMADHTAGYASFTLIPEDKVILTVEYKINFLRPASGDFLECRAKVINQGKSILVCESEVYSIAEGNEDMVAKAMLTMASVSKERVREK